MSILDFFNSHCKNCPLSRSYFGSWRQALVAAAIVEMWQLRRALNKSKCMDCPLGQNKEAIVEGWPLWRGDC